jgi:hypothetical protein
VRKKSRAKTAWPKQKRRKRISEECRRKNKRRRKRREKLSGETGLQTHRNAAEIANAEDIRGGKSCRRWGGQK